MHQPEGLPIEITSSTNSGDISIISSQGPGIESSDRAAQFVALASRISRPADNLSTSVVAFSWGSLHFPVSVNDGAASTCYVCCPSTAYIDYALAELRNLRGSFFKASLGLLIKGLGRLLIRLSRLDRQVQVNNWLFATNVIPQIEAEALPELTQSLCRLYVDSNVIWRSLNTYSDGEKIRAFKKSGYRLLPARQIYMFDCRQRNQPVSRDERRDAKLGYDNKYDMIAGDDIQTGEFVRIASLYRKLYIDKYTPLNPQYTPDFLEGLHRARIVEFYGLRSKDGQLDGVIGFFCVGDTMTAPIVGYDTALPAADGLYRRLMSIGMQLARERRLLLNLSAGAASFKRNRKALPAIEYMAVYNRHLGLRPRAAAFVVESILSGIGLPLLRRFEL